MVDMEQFIAQITPLIVLMILFPASIMIFYFTIVRPYMRKRGGAAAGDKNKAVPAASSALDMLRQAQTEAVMEEAIASDSDIDEAEKELKLEDGDLV